jgi:thiamine biosynthesis lipoprotein
MRIWLFVSLVLFPALVFAAEQPRQTTIIAMGGIPIHVSAWGLEQDAFRETIPRIFKRIEYLEDILSTYREDSVISQINHGGFEGPLPPELHYLLFNSQLISAETDGAFDVTVQPLVQLWRDAREADRLPADEDFEEAFASVGYRKVRLNSKAQIEFAVAGMMLDFGGIAKGYFADEAIQLLRQAGARRCLVDVGGDIRSWQAADSTEPFRIGIKHPINTSEMLLKLEVPRGAVVTSGNYERFFEIDGKRYCHIFDPRTGQPVEGLLSVSLVADTGLIADAYATAVFVMGWDGGREFVESHPGLEAVIVATGDSEGIEVYVSPGLIDAVEFY